jgi:ABC-type glycerol-3-phosphate transport system substrate-binding protein
MMIPVYAAPQVTITVWACDALTRDDANTHYARELVKNFEKLNPNIKVEWSGLGINPLKDKVKIAMATNQGPDIFQSWGGSLMGEYADAGRLLNLTKELKGLKCSGAAKNAMSTPFPINV